jgi:hypothetical protein
MKIADPDPTTVAVPKETAGSSSRRSVSDAPAAAPPSGTQTGNSNASVVRFFSSLRLTVVLLAMGMVLVFAGTIAQVNMGLYKAQNEFFRGLFIFWGPQGANWKIPVFPGGYLVGTLLLVNLLAAHVTRFKFTRKKAGIWLTHVGVIMLLVGQLLTDLLAHESALHLREGEAKNYSEAQREDELAVIDVTDPKIQKVVAIPQRLLNRRNTIETPHLPFKIDVKQFYPNSDVERKSADTILPGAATQGVGQELTLRAAPKVTEMDVRDIPSGVIEIKTPAGSLGTWLVSEFLNKAQTLSYDGRTYELQMRPRRFYRPYSLKLLKFTHAVYAGTDTPKDFSSRLVLDRPNTGEHREVLIYMNNPLRYAGETFYQASFDPDDHGTVLQVVHNPGWLTPYFSCILVALGLLVQFGTHLVGFASKRKSKGVPQMKAVAARPQLPVKSKR